MTSACTAKRPRNTVPATQTRHPIRPIIRLTRRPRRQIATTRAATPSAQSETQSTFRTAGSEHKASSPLQPEEGLLSPIVLPTSETRQRRRDKLHVSESYVQSLEGIDLTAWPRPRSLEPSKAGPADHCGGVRPRKPLHRAEPVGRQRQAGSACASMTRRRELGLTRNGGNRWGYGSGAAQRFQRA